MLLGARTTVSRLVTVDGDRSRLVGEVVSHVDQLSIRRGSRAHLRKLPGMIARSIAAASTKDEHPDENGAGTVPAPALAAPKGLGTLAVARGVAATGLGFFGRLVDRTLRPEQWTVEVSSQGCDPRQRAGSRFRTLEAPPGRWWADPFPVRSADGDIVFVEEYLDAERRGRITVVTLDDSARGWSATRPVLDLPTHLSYPFVFRWEGSWYLLPEQAATGGLDLYVSDRFPESWRWHSRILDIPAADATLEEIDGRWWMFAATAVESGAPADQLLLFHAESPLGPWIPHAWNPVVSDVRTARSAGRLQHRDGRWYRVAQDGSASYGYAIYVLRIDRLDLDGYQESVVDVIEPDWEPGLRGTHTLNTDQGLTAVDVRRAVWRSVPRP
jgi:hypothetical protein